MIDTLQIEIRPMGEDDKAFVASSWKKSFRSSSTVSWVGNSNYYDEMNKRVETQRRRCIQPEGIEPALRLGVLRKRPCNNPLHVRQTGFQDGPSCH